MHVFIAGGNGRTGRLAIEQLLSRGHTVTALVRNPDSLPPKDGLIIVKGTPAKVEDIENAFAQQRPDAVVDTLCAPKTSPKGLLTACVNNILTVMESFKVQKIVYMSAFGVGDSYSALNFLMKGVLCGTYLGEQFVDHQNAEDAMRAANQSRGVRWVAVRSSMLKETPKAKPILLLGEKGEKASFMPSITVRSVAKFIADAVEGTVWDGTTPVICN